ncbi:MAG: hypothetical protein JJU11_16335 [Candidatus Sumerlaeia bacterium]|nr:hypothetical protein [Candidatus Sumerlaeia bacterium]
MRNASLRPALSPRLYNFASEGTYYIVFSSSSDAIKEPSGSVWKIRNYPPMGQNPTFSGFYEVSRESPCRFSNFH